MEKTQNRPMLINYDPSPDAWEWAHFKNWLISAAHSIGVAHPEQFDYLTLFDIVSHGIFSGRCMPYKTEAEREKEAIEQDVKRRYGPDARIYGI